MSEDNTNNEENKDDEDRKKREEARKEKKRRINQKKQQDAANKRNEEYLKEESKYYRKRDPNAKIFNREGQEVADDGSIIVDDSPVTGPVIEPNEGDIETDEFGNPKYAQSITFEVGANVALDKATSWLLGAPIPGARPLYALANVGGSGIINYLAQRIRGTEFSLGELATASGLSLVPGGTQAKTLKGAIGKSTVKGAGLGAVQVTSESLIDTGELPDAETFATGTLFGGAAGGIFQTAADSDEVLKALRKRIRNPFDDAITVYAMSPKKGTRKNIPSNPEERSALEAKGQENVFKSFQKDPRLGESDEALYAQYKALDAKYDNKTLGDTIDENLTARQKREKYGRNLQATDLDVIIQEEALRGRTIPPEKAQEYVDLVNETRLGKKDRNNPTKRLRRNQKGYIGTMVYLNEVSLGVNPNNLGNTADVINHISKEMGTDPIGLKRIIEGQGGEIVFQTEGMTAPKKIRTLKELVEAYYLRLQRYKEIPAFEKGHVFAANNIIEDKNISSLTDFLNNLEPEISRSIREQLDDQAIEELIAAKNKVKNDDFFRSVVDGNRKRQNKADPDKILADLLGTQYGLRESFLSFVYPERSLSNIIPEDSKAEFAELYRAELLERIKDLRDQLTGESSFGIDRIDKMKMQVALEVAEGFKDNEILNKMILMNDQIYKIDKVTDTGVAKPATDDIIKTEKDKTIKKNTKQEGE